MFDKLKKMQERVDNDPELAKLQEEIVKNPELMFKFPAEKQKAYLRGFFDYHGSIFIDERGHFILSILSHDVKKIDVTQQLLEKFNISSFVYHQLHPEKMTEPSRLLIVGIPDILEFDNVIGMENPALNQRFQEVLLLFLEKERLLEDHNSEEK